MQCWKRTPSMERCQTTSAPTRQDRSRIDRAPKRVETESDWTPPPRRSSKKPILGHTHASTSLHHRTNSQTHTHIHTNNPKQTQTEYETGRVGGVSYSKSSPAQCAQVTLGTRHESRCTDNTDFQPDYQHSDVAPPTTKSG